ncbi:hypothetical protein GCM10009712_16670 [Pseudarthrobacter sulfonivorans]
MHLPVRGAAVHRSSNTLDEGPATLKATLHCPSFRWSRAVGGNNWRGRGGVSTRIGGSIDGCGRSVRRVDPDYRSAFAGTLRGKSGRGKAGAGQLPGRFKAGIGAVPVSGCAGRDTCRRR